MSARNHNEPNSNIRQVCDGIICFGGVDWWYHNRGHYDLQMMREFSRAMPVLYVNSIGMRMPRPGPGRMFAHRVARKLKSIRRGLHFVHDTFAVGSPLALPGSLGPGLNRRCLPWQVRRWARQMGINSPLVWVACPPAIEAVDSLDPTMVVYQRTDRFECYKDVNAAEIQRFDRQLKERADLTVFCSTMLMEQEREQCRRAAFVDHGVDYDRFANAGRDAQQDPPEVSHIPRPRVGFVGGIDSHTFDPSLFNQLAASLPDVHFVLVGACSLKEGWCTLENVYQIGQKPYEDVPQYMASCDVLIMPWNGSDWIQACNPVKLKEYLAVGRPVISTPFAELAAYGDQVSVVDDAASFSHAIKRALLDAGDIASRRRRVATETWTAKADLMRRYLFEAGSILKPTSGSACQPNAKPVETRASASGAAGMLASAESS